MSCEVTSVIIAAEVGEGLCLSSAPPLRTQGTGTALNRFYLENKTDCPVQAALQVIDVLHS